MNWTKEQIIKLKTLRLQGKTLTELSLIFNKTVGQIASKCYRDRIPCIDEDTLIKQNLIGQKINYLTVLEPLGKLDGRAFHYLCECVCGNKVKIRFGRLKNKESKSCGCKDREFISGYKLVGKRFGRLLVTKELKHKPGERYILWECLCDCGRTTISKTTSLVYRSKLSCGCLNAEARMKDLTNKCFGKLIAISRSKRMGKGTTWLCKCDCGGSKVIRTRSLIAGSTKSCGCLRLELIKNKPKKLNNKKYDKERQKTKYLRTNIWFRDLNCIVTGSSACPLVAHHLNSWKDFPEQRFIRENCITIREDLHLIYHQIYKRNITKESFKEFIMKLQTGEISLEKRLAEKVARATAKRIIKEIICKETNIKYSPKLSKAIQNIILLEIQNRDMEIKCNPEIFETLKDFVKRLNKIENNESPFELL